MPSLAGLIHEASPRCTSSRLGCVRSGLISRARCQTVPSPFGSGSSDSGVASCSLHSLLVHATAEALREECGGVELEHQSTLNSPRRRRHLEMLSLPLAMSSV